MIRFLLVAALCVTLPFTARAQDVTFTILDLGPLNLDLEKATPTPAEALGKIRNPEMRSVLELQNQITMLNALTAWQEQVNKLRSVYAKVGMSFEQPAPPLALCEQVPPNSLCGDAYPEMAPEDDSALFIPEPVKSAAMDAPKAKAKTKSASASAAPPKPEAEYEWESVQCRGSDCTAILQEIATGSRFRMLQGETVREGIMVQSISPDGVTLTVKGQAQKLRPTVASAAKKPASDAAPESLQDALKGMPAAPDPIEPIVLDDGGASAAPPSSNNSGTGQVGATGLF